MTVTVNGTHRDMPEGASLGMLCGELDLPGTGVAVALDGDVVARQAWPTTELHDGARVEILTAVGGG
jgi:sulfur carrier protein